MKSPVCGSQQPVRFSGVRASTVLGGTKLGDSIAVNGVCLTVVRLTGDGFEGDVMPETMRRTNLGALKPKSRVNLERAMAADGDSADTSLPDTWTAPEPLQIYLRKEMPFG